MLYQYSQFTAFDLFFASILFPNFNMCITYNPCRKITYGYTLAFTLGQTSVDPLISMLINITTRKARLF